MPEAATNGPSTRGASAPLVDGFRAARSELLGRPVASRPARRLALTALTDDWLGEVFVRSGAGELGACLVAVGGYGRRELTAGSDLDLVLVLPDALDPTDAAASADALWYPIWDSGVPVDHSVRTVAEARRVAAQDLRAILGLLDCRVIAGDRALGERLASSILGDWRALARTRLAELRGAVEQRRARSGEVAHLLEPDLKEGYGGLRDAAILSAISASWITDVPHLGLEDARQRILDIRDALHDCAIAESRRPSDVLRSQDQAEVAERLGLAGRDDLLREVSEAARTIAYASDTMWHRVDRLARERRGLRRRLRRPGPERVPLADGVVVHEGEVVLALDTRPDRDPVLVLRLAAAAAQAGLPVGPAAMQRLARESAPMPLPWPGEARDALVSLLGAGACLIPVWEALDRHGLIVRLIPEWAVVRSAPQGNPVHVYRVDRHLVQTAAEASAHLREVDRPDLLLVAALLHDIGKARPGDHSEVGARLTASIAQDLGFDDADRDVLVRLVEHHLLLADTAMRRDLDDPVTSVRVMEAVGTSSCLQLLHALTYADAAATGPGAWSEWKATLVDDLVRRARALLQGEVLSAAPAVAERFPELMAADGLQLECEVGSPASTVVVAARDRPGLLGAIAGTLALHRLEVKSADTQTVGDRAVTAWSVTPFFGDFPDLDLIRADLVRALSGELDVSERLAHRRRAPASATSPPPRVDFVPGAASEADVLEVRAHDEPALLHRIGEAIRQAGATISAARVETLGSEVVDVFYLQRADGGRLDPAERARVVGVVLDRLQQGDGIGTGTSA